MFLSLDLFHPFFTKRKRLCEERCVEMEDLVTYLRMLEESDIPTIAEHEDVFLQHEDHELVGQIEGLATTLFIDEKGSPRFEDMDTLWHEHGFFVFPGERDQFGWLTGCIRTKKGIIVFG